MWLIDLVGNPALRLIQAACIQGFGGKPGFRFVDFGGKPGLGRPMPSKCKSKLPFWWETRPLFRVDLVGNPASWLIQSAWIQGFGGKPGLRIADFGGKPGLGRPMPSKCKAKLPFLVVNPASRAS
jgi:hypothetical protein